jgi:6-phospho-3-hexuloisomerase
MYYITGIIIREIGEMLDKIPLEAVEALSTRILQHPRIFVAGAGRSGLMVKAFSMRLMHLGLITYVAGETVTPGIDAGDLLLIGSGSGETSSLVSMASKACQIGASVALITIYPESAIGRIANQVVEIKASTPKHIESMDKEVTQPVSVQPKGSLYEQCLLLFLDAVVIDIMRKKGFPLTACFSIMPIWNKCHIEQVRKAL